MVKQKIATCNHFQTINFDLLRGVTDDMLAVSLRWMDVDELKSHLLQFLNHNVIIKLANVVNVCVISGLGA